MSEHTPELLELVRCAELVGIEYHELSAKRVPAPSQERDEEDGEEHIAPEYGLAVDIARDLSKFRLRLRIELNPVGGHVVTEAAAEYLVGEFPAESIKMPLLIEYANEVGVMALLPYLRQAIADLTLRVFGDPVLMPVLPRGSVAFAVAEGGQTP